MKEEVERPEILREHFAECLAHFAKLFSDKYPSGRKNRYEPLKSLVDFCDGIEESTIRRWFDGTIPTGELWLKLACYLDVLGYKIIEFERFPKPLRNFSELIGFGVISAEEASKSLGFAQTSSIFGVIRGERGMSSDREDVMYQIWKTKRVDLEARKKKALEEIQVDFLSKTKNDVSHEEIEAREVLALPPPSAPISSRRSATLNIMRGLCTLLEEDLFGGLSTGRVEGLEQDDVFCVAKLSAQLSQLSLKLVQKGKE